MNEVIKLDNICKSYDGKSILRNLSFSVRKNTIHGLLGPNGAGKTTTMKVVTGLITPNSGSIEIDEEYLGNVAIGYLPELPPLYFDMKVKDYLFFIQKIYSKGGKVDEKRISNIIEKLSLGNVQGRLIKNLSKGYKQRVGMAQAMVYGSHFLIFDEPIVGLDPKSVTEVRDFILRMKEDHTILISSHQLHEISLICDDITIINDGKVVLSGSLEEVESKIRPFHLYKSTLSDWNEIYEKEVLEKFKIEVRDIKKKNNHLDIIFINNTGIDYRSELVEYFVEKKLKVYYFSEEGASLEEIYQEILKGK